jgi:hypothetical protein
MTVPKYTVSYEEYLFMGKDVEWVKPDMLNLFINKNNVKRERIIAAIDKGIVNF